jgi:hypothetical protein
MAWQLLIDGGEQGNAVQQFIRQLVELGRQQFCSWTEVVRHRFCKYSYSSRGRPAIWCGIEYPAPATLRHASSPYRVT